MSDLSEKEMLDFVMPFGEHIGEKIGDVPIDYLLWLWKENRASGALKEILENFEDEISEAKSWFVAPKLKEVVRV